MALSCPTFGPDESSDVSRQVNYARIVSENLSASEVWIDSGKTSVLQRHPHSTYKTFYRLSYRKPGGSMSEIFYLNDSLNIVAIEFIKKGSRVELNVLQFQEPLLQNLVIEQIEQILWQQGFLE